MPFLMGRKPRIHNPTVAHMSALMAGRSLPPPPAQVNYLAKMPDDLGMMMNDQLGDCTCAAVYHAIQVWTANCGAMQTNPDSDVLSIYERFCGYNPADPDTDQGGIEQTVLGDWMHTGVPIVAGTNKLTAFLEVDPRQIDDVKRTIAECGVCYIGFNVPSNIMPPDAAPPLIWQYDPSAQSIGGHAIALAGYDANHINLISWGAKYQMTWEFFQRTTDEAYAIIDSDWLNATGKTPLGLTSEQLIAQMQGLRRFA